MKINFYFALLHPLIHIIEFYVNCTFAALLPYYIYNMQHQGCTEYYILVPICLHYVKFLAEEFRNTMHELLLYGLDLSVVGKCVSESPRVKSANRSSFSSGCGPFGLAFSAKRTSWPTSTISVHRQNAKQSVKPWEKS